MNARKKTVTKSPDNEHKAGCRKRKAPRRKYGCHCIRRPELRSWDPAARQVTRRKEVYT